MGKYFEDGLSSKEKRKQILIRNGSRVKEIRKMNGLTQSKFIEQLEIKGKKTLVSEVENGKRTLPAYILPVIAEMGDTSVESFFIDESIIDYKGSLFKPFLTAMGYSEDETEHIGLYMEKLTTQAINKSSEAKVFDLIFSILKHAAENEKVASGIVEEVYMIDEADYSNGKSKFAGFINDYILQKKIE